VIYFAYEMLYVLILEFSGKTGNLSKYSVQIGDDKEKGRKQSMPGDIVVVICGK